MAERLEEYDAAQSARVIYLPDPPLNADSLVMYADGRAT